MCFGNRSLNRNNKTGSSSSNKQQSKINNTINNINNKNSNHNNGKGLTKCPVNIVTRLLDCYTPPSKDMIVQGQVLWPPITA
ncbi:hypothetical protein PoB_004778100 [Plakobranchus ocellatus]|uniref:Uncharacterized protein n=1 Tax=Plakobranchus ocellatus TaxID=259542 RepID=A0AAV4BLI4_9GAST|nr:hypothetical protein PoB_004778100 [Plakobranchus ocellatus]